MVAAEKWGYSLAVMVLVVGGAALRTVILNWLCGPAVVVGSVALTTGLAHRRGAAAPQHGESTP